MKCIIMLHFIWVFTHCQSTRCRGFGNTKGLTKTCEYDQKMPQSQTTEPATAPRGRNTELRQPQDRKSTVKVKQPPPPLRKTIPDKKRNTPGRTIQLSGRLQVMGKFRFYQCKGLLRGKSRPRRCLPVDIKYCNIKNLLQAGVKNVLMKIGYEPSGG